MRHRRGKQHSYVIFGESYRVPSAMTSHLPSQQKCEIPLEFLKK